MLDYEKIDKARLLKADKVSEFIKNQFSLSHITIALNMINDDINVELNQREVTSELLTALKEKLGTVYQSRYKIRPTPILSGSYMDNPMSRATVLYLFEKM